MKNITLAIDDEVLDKVRVVAARKRMTVNAMVRDFLTEIAGRDEKLARGAPQSVAPHGGVGRPHGRELEIQPRGNP